MNEEKEVVYRMGFWGFLGAFLMGVVVAGACCYGLAYGLKWVDCHSNFMKGNDSTPVFIVTTFNRTANTEQKFWTHAVENLGNNFVEFTEMESNDFKHVHFDEVLIQNVTEDYAKLPEGAKCCEN